MSTFIAFHSSSQSDASSFSTTRSQQNGVMHLNLTAVKPGFDIRFAIQLNMKMMKYEDGLLILGQNYIWSIEATTAVHISYNQLL